MAVAANEVRDVDRRQRIRAGDDEHLSGAETAQCAARAQHRERAFQPTQVEVANQAVSVNQTELFNHPVLPSIELPHLPGTKAPLQ